jgi:hypothetical protein
MESYFGGIYAYLNFLRRFFTLKKWYGFNMYFFLDQLNTIHVLHGCRDSVGRDLNLSYEFCL